MQYLTEQAEEMDPELAALLEPDQETPDQPEPTPEGETQGNP